MIKKKVYFFGIPEDKVIKVMGIEKLVNEIIVENS